jgi:molybdopterin molybdotransferase
VEIRPGRPLVFGRVRGVPFFGLPGNPLSTMITFELFVRPALAVLGGAPPPPLSMLRAPLAEAYRQRPVPLLVFVPARLDAAVHPLSSQGSGDLAALARADALMVIEPGVAEQPAGALVPLLPK